MSRLQPFAQFAVFVIAVALLIFWGLGRERNRPRESTPGDPFRSQPAHQSAEEKLRREMVRQGVNRKEAEEFSKELLKADQEYRRILNRR